MRSPFLLLCLAACGGDDGTTDRPSTQQSLPPAEEEVCNQLDDDGDGQVDEICGCAPGETQACWSGVAGQRGVGACRDGVQSCDAGDPEFPSWGTCDGEIGATAEVCGNGADDDCDGMADEDCTPPGCGAGDIPEPERCFNRVDDDCDGLTDCLDPDCDCGEIGDGERECAPGECRYWKDCEAHQGHNKIIYCVDGYWVDPGWVSIEDCNALPEGCDSISCCW
jgi:putative metal-binding protein